MTTARGLWIRNDEIAGVLDRVADALEAQGAGTFRVRAWRTAASNVRSAPRPLSDLFATAGVEGLDALPGIGPSIASAIGELLSTGRLGMLERLQGESSPDALFASVPGIGPELARRIQAELGVETLEELELTAHDGRLARVPGFGSRRTRLVKEALAGMLSRSVRRHANVFHRAGYESRPNVETLLDVDREYRRRAAAGELRTITPRRFNPHKEAWLPVLHTERAGWTFTALYSNTARAHELGTTRDWVVLYYERDGYEGQCTVVTERRGPLTGQRVVRGREWEMRIVPPREESPLAESESRS